MDTSGQFSDMAERLFGDFVNPALLEAAEDGAFPQAMWSAVEAAGIGLALVPEEAGGIGGAMSDAAAIMRAAGRHAAPGPVLELIFGNYLLGLAGQEPLAGPLALGFVEPHAASSGALSVRDVPWAQAATHVLLIATDGGAARVALLPNSSLTLHSGNPDASGEPRASIEANDLVWTPLSGADAAGCLRCAALLRAAQMTGAMQWCLQRTIEYSQERKQFGREIGKFQVVQQMIAELASAVVAAQAIVDAAIAAPASNALVAAARSRLGDAVDTVCAVSHQVHGAMGFSYEYALHFRTRRLMAWRDEFGTVSHWRRVLARHFAGCRADDVWPKLAAIA